MKDKNLVTNVELKISIIYYPEIEERPQEIIHGYGLEGPDHFLIV